MRRTLYDAISPWNPSILEEVDSFLLEEVKLSPDSSPFFSLYRGNRPSIKCCRDVSLIAPLELRTLAPEATYCIRKLTISKKPITPVFLKSSVDVNLEAYLVPVRNPSSGRAPCFVTLWHSSASGSCMPLFFLENN